MKEFQSLTLITMEMGFHLSVFQPPRQFDGKDRGGRFSTQEASERATCYGESG